MRETLLALVELQKIDDKVLEVEKSANAVPPKIKVLEDSLDEHRVTLGELNTQLEALRGELSAMVGKNAEEQAKHRKWKSRLNDLKSPRDFQALSRELEMGERAVTSSEERMSELKKEIDDKEVEILSRQERFEEKERDVLHQIKALRLTHKELRVEAEAAAQGRGALLDTLPARVKKAYDRLKKARGTGVAIVRGGACSGCNMTLRPQLIVELLRFDRLDTCPSCKRLIVHEDILPVEEEEEAEVS